MRITKEAVAREARKSPATLYRLPDVVDAINSSASANPQEQRVSQSEQRRKALLVQIEDLEKENGLLLSENFRLQRLLAMYDPTLGDNKPIDLAASREQKRLAKGMPPTRDLKWRVLELNTGPQIYGRCVTSSACNASNRFGNARSRAK